MIATLYEYRAFIASVYDGDSLRADVDLGFGVVIKKMPLRLSGIDAPEVKGEDRPLGLASRDALSGRILGREVIIRTEKDRTGKFGRYLATIWLDGENINQWLVEQGHAKPYSA